MCLFLPIFLLLSFHLASDKLFLSSTLPSSFLLPSGLDARVPALPCGVMPLIPTAYKQLGLWSRQYGPESLPVHAYD